MNIESPPPYTPYQSSHQQTYIVKSMPECPKDINDETKKQKIRTIIPFPFYDIDITDFPKIKFIKNSVTDGTCIIV